MSRVRRTTATEKYIWLFQGIFRIEKQNHKGKSSSAAMANVVPSYETDHTMLDCSRHAPKAADVVERNLGRVRGTTMLEGSRKAEDATDSFQVEWCANSCPNTIACALEGDHA